MVPNNRLLCKTYIWEVFECITYIKRIIYNFKIYNCKKGNTHLIFVPVQIILGNTNLS